LRAGKAGAKPATGHPPSAGSANGKPAPGRTTAKAATSKAGDPESGTAEPGDAKPATRKASRKAADWKAGESKAAAGAAADGADDEVPRWAAKALEQLLHVTCWLDPGEDGEPLTATVRFTGQRTDVTGKPGPGDTFTQEEIYQGIVPGSGPVAVTAEVRGVNPGTWSVTARPVRRAVVGQSRPAAVTEPAAAGRVPRPRRVTVQAGPNTTVHTASMLRSKVPGVIRYAYACLVVLGVLTGLAIEGVLLATGSLSGAPA
jgi:hypothetical protein